MIKDWMIYTEEIDELMAISKIDLQEKIFDCIKEAIGNNLYFFLDRMIPLIDRDKDDLTLRLSDECFYDKNDDRNILFNIKDEINDYDGGDFKRLDRLIEIFQNSINLMKDKIVELEKEWERDDDDEDDIDPFLSNANNLALFKPN
jgi:hypothetical protein